MASTLEHVLGRCALALLLSAAMLTAVASARRPAPLSRADLIAILESARAKYGLPSVAAAVIENGRIGAVAAVGVRKVGDPTEVTEDDAYHIGSDTKAMTATVAAMLVDRGKLRWDTTIGEDFPELSKPPMSRPEYPSVTLLQLLSHHAGMPAETWPTGSPDWRLLSDSLPKQRYAYVKLALRDPPEAPPGTKYIYANRGYIVAGAMLERVTGQAWEDLVRTHIFRPLDMKTAGFGWMASPGKVDAPWPHIAPAKAGGQPIPVPPGPRADNPLVLGPAGTVHCSAADHARFCLLQLHGAAPDGTRLLKPETLARLHEPPFGGDYALGWLVVDRPWASGKALSHAGSNTMNYTVVWLAPRRDLGVVIDTNVGDAGQALDDVAAAVISRIAPR